MAKKPPFLTPDTKPKKKPVPATDPSAILPDDDQPLLPPKKKPTSTKKPGK